MKKTFVVAAMLIAAACVFALIPSDAYAAAGSSLAALDPFSAKSLLLQASGGLAAVHAAADSIARADHDAAVATARAEGEAAGRAAVEGDLPAQLAAARAEGAGAERARIAGIEAAALPGHEALVAAMKADGAVTAEAAALRILNAEKALRAGQLQGVMDVERATGNVGSAPLAGDRPGAAAPGASSPKTPEALRAEYDASDKLRAEFPTAEGYAAFAKAEAAGRVRILGGRA